MRALMALVEGDHHLVRTAELSAARRAGILRADDPGLEDLSATDLARALRALYGLSGRGRPVPPVFAATATTLGWMGTGPGAREVLFCARPRTGLARALQRKRPTLVLVPSARHLTPLLRERHAPGARVELEALEEGLVVLSGRLVRRTALAPDVPGIPLPPVQPGAASPPDGSPATPPMVLLRGLAKRWTEMRLCMLDGTTVRVDVGGRCVRCTHIDFGMAHAHTRKPTRAWEVVEEICERGGYFRTSRLGNADATKKLIHRVSRDLQELFGIAGSPFYRYRSDCGWRSRFEARPDLPEDQPR